MELPIPVRGESRDTFIVRCMRDTTLTDLFPVWEQRLSICYHQWNTSCDLGNVTDGGIMKATLEFNLPEDQDQFTAATHGMDYFLCLFDMDQYLRNIIKYGEEFSPDGKAMAAEIRERLTTIMNGRGVSTDDIS